MAEIEIVEALEGPDIDAAKALIRAYVAWLGVDLSHQGFEAEMETFPGQYAPPKGALLLVRVDGVPAGVVGLRPLDGDICEMKRLWVAPEFSGFGLGRRLCTRFLEEGCRLGYRTVRLDTVARAQAANHIYRSMGFREIPAYRYNPEPDALYFERSLPA
ncbi:MAG: GNAT family N-acetyltransferase [Alphaproteobacteria bacterium]